MHMPPTGLAALALILMATSAQTEDATGFWNFKAPVPQASACQGDISAASDMSKKWGTGVLRTQYGLAAMARQVSLHECGCRFRLYSFTQFVEDALAKKPGDLTRADVDTIRARTEKFQAQITPWYQMQKTICKGKD